MRDKLSVGDLSELIVNVPDFPKPGIQFKDITRILEDGLAFRSLAQHLREQVFPGTTKLVAIESRGFLLAAAIAQYLDAGVVLVRKPGKLPRPTVAVSYNLEYGDDTLELHSEALGENDKVTIVDDVLATGGTAQAVENLIVKTGAKVLGSCFLMELTSLRGSRKLSFPYRTLLKV
jgi:adenine phosphoribosyltransferase